jgi:hypothetical protein
MKRTRSKNLVTLSLYAPIVLAGLLFALGALFFITYACEHPHNAFLLNRCISFTIVLRILCEFFIEPPPDTQREEGQGTGHGERQRKKNMGCCVLLSVVHSPPPPPLSPILHAISPARGYGYQDYRHREESPSPPPPPYPHLCWTV